MPEKTKQDYALEELREIASRLTPEQREKMKAKLQKVYAERAEKKKPSVPMTPIKEE